MSGGADSEAWSGTGPQAGQDAELIEQIMRINNELANVQRELSRRNTELSRRNDEKNQLLGMAAHDLRNPIAIIHSCCQLLAAGSTDSLDDDQRELVDIMQNSSRVLLALLEGVLDITSIHAGKLELNREPSDLVEMTRQSVRLGQYLALHKQIRLQFEPEPDIPLLSLDAARFGQVIDNLLSNAVKYSPSGREVLIRIARACEEDTEQVVLCVTDHGPGIAPEALDRLFQPFGRPRTHAGDGSGSSSTGLGLAIAHKIVTAHGGALRVRSEVDRGSTFSVVLAIEAPA